MNKKYCFFISLVVVLLDQATKAFILKYQHFLPYTVTNFLDIVYVRNKGISFGLLNDIPLSNYLIYINSGILGGVLWWMFQPKQKNIRFQAALILGGGVGNLIDRFRWEKVIDFICFHIKDYYWPSFNIADSAITLAVVSILWQTMKTDRIKDYPR